MAADARAETGERALLRRILDAWESGTCYEDRRYSLELSIRAVLGLCPSGGCLNPRASDEDETDGYCEECCNG